MKQLSLVLSIVAVGLSGVLLFMHIKEKDGAKRVIALPLAASANSSNNFRIAYFELDSLQNNYQYFKDELNKLKSKEEAEQNELTSMEKSYRKKVADWQQKWKNMSPAEQEAANSEIQQMQQNLQNRKQQLDQNINDQMNDTRKKIRDRLESYLKEYNRDKSYSYIFSDFPEGIFYKDTVYNITNDLIKGLNESYRKKE